MTNKIKLFNIIIILTSLFGYLEWGDQSAFLFQAELEIIAILFTDPASIIHPFTLIPLAGQILLMVTLFQQKPSKWLTVLGIICLAVLLLLMLFIGIMASELKTALSVLPFVIISVLQFRNFRKLSAN